MAADDEFATAVMRARRRQRKMPTAVAARYDRRARRIVVQLSSGMDNSFAPRDAQGLANAEPDELDEIEISPSGFGIHFPILDADLCLPGLLEGQLGSRRWMPGQRRSGRAPSNDIPETAAAPAGEKHGKTAAK